MKDYQKYINALRKYARMLENDRTSIWNIVIPDLLTNTANLLETIEQEQKTGHWVRVDENKLKCSACEVIHMIAQYPSGKIGWCPNCGAKMVEVKEDEM